MKNKPDVEEVIHLKDTEVGMLRGLWGVAVEGYTWDEELQPIPGVNIRAGTRRRREEKGPWLRPTNLSPDAEARLYPVLRDRRVLTDFAALSVAPDHDKIKRFADKWGLLGRDDTALHGKHLPNGWIVAEPAWLWDRELFHFRVLWETWVAVRTIKFADSHTSPEVQAAHALLRKRIDWRRVNGGSVGYRAELEEGSTMSLIATAKHHPDTFRYFDYGDLVGPARYYVHDEVNKRLKGHVNLSVLVSVVPSDDGRIRFSPSDLLSAIYVHFALDLARASGVERACESCEQPFFVQRRDQRFCGKNCRERAGYHRRAGGK